MGRSLVRVGQDCGSPSAKFVPEGFWFADPRKRPSGRSGHQEADPALTIGMGSGEGLPDHASVDEGTPVLEGTQGPGNLIHHRTLPGTDAINQAGATSVPGCKDRESVFLITCTGGKERRLPCKREGVISGKADAGPGPAPRRAGGKEGVAEPCWAVCSLCSCSWA